MTADLVRLEVIFSEALSLGAVDARAAYLDQACGGDAQLRMRVNALLAAHAAADNPLRLSADDRRSAPLDVLCDRPGTRIGNYRLIAQIGEGGFGVVHAAEQEHPVRRQVAIKVIKIGMDTRQVVARFEAERQALAMMDHPGIARVFDAGATADGRPYFVMELVRGVAITDYCDAHCLPLRRRLELFVGVCQAVQHAHQKGIIHRDLKPTNVLVAECDERPVAKVIDFGVAKAVGSQWAQETLFTRLGQVVGTLDYMSPEQASLNQNDVDTRSDIYSLGVLLYELLTGAVPFDRQRLRAAAFDDVLRIIREEEPPRPSARFSTLQGLPGIAAKRALEPGQLGDAVRGELDWIVMKCLEKDRARRYDSAAALAADVGRHLADEPVAAAAPSRAYLLRKFMRRHRRGVVASCAVGLALTLGVIGTGLGLLWAIRAADAAQKQREKAEQIAQFLADTLKGVGPSAARGRDTVMLREILDAAAARIESGELRQNFEAEVPLRLNIGETYREIAAYPQAERMFRPALEHAEAAFGPSHPLVAAALDQYAGLLHEVGRAQEALPLVQKALAIRQALHPGDHPDVAATMHDLGTCLQTLGRSGEALPRFEESLAMRQRLFQRDSPAVAEGLNAVALCLQVQGRAGDALPKFETALAIWKRLYPGDHPDVATGLNNAGLCLQALGRDAEALPRCQEALAMVMRLYPHDHPDVARELNVVGSCLNALGRYPDALTHYEAAVAMCIRVYPPGHLHTAECQVGLGETLLKLGRCPEAEGPLIQAGRRLIGRPDALPGWQRRLYQALIELYERRESAQPGRGYADLAAEWRRRFADFSRPSADGNPP